MGSPEWDAAQPLLRPLQYLQQPAAAPTPGPPSISSLRIILPSYFPKGVFLWDLHSQVLGC